MLKQVSKDLKLTDYNLSRVVTSGTEHFIKLKVTNQKDVKTYREIIKQMQAGEEIDFNAVQRPFTRIEIIDQNPVQVLV